MKILHTSDLHIGKSLDGFSRIEEQEQFLHFLVDTCESLQPDIIIIAGDIFDTANPSALAETLFYECISQISSKTKSLIVIIAGNHDSPKRLASAKSLAKSHGIIIYEHHNDEIILGQYKHAKILSCNNGVIKVEINNKIANIMAIPYISEARLNETLVSLSDTDEQGGKSFQEKFETIINDKVKYFDNNEYNIMIAHLFTAKSNIENTNLGYSIGGAYIVDASAFPQNADYIALGHIHKYQVVSGVNKRAYYCGSPIHYNKTEAKTEKKHILLAQLSKEKELTVEKIQIPIYKKIDIWQANSVEQAIQMSEERKDENSFVYLEIKTDRVISNEEIRIIKSNKKDIIEIRPILMSNDIFTVTENMLDKSDEDKFIEFFKEKNKVQPDDKIVKRYIDIANFEI